MKFCQNHWDKLKDAIKARGIFDFVAGSGEEAVKQMKEQLEGKPEAIERFDPLMAAHWAIANNAIDVLKRIGQSPLIMMAPDPEYPQLECPICCLNFLSAEHDRTCSDPNCKKTKGQTFDGWIDRAADEALEKTKELQSKQKPK